MQKHAIHYKTLHTELEMETITIYGVGYLILLKIILINLHWWTIVSNKVFVGDQMWKTCKTIRTLPTPHQRLSDYIGKRCFSLARTTSILMPNQRRVIIVRQSRRYFNWKLSAVLAITQHNPIQSNVIDVRAIVARVNAAAMQQHPSTIIITIKNK